MIASRRILAGCFLAAAAPALGADADAFADSALIVVDVQTDFVDDTCFSQFHDFSQQPEPPLDKQAAKEWTDYMQSAVSWFEDRGAVVIHTTDAHPAKHLSFYNDGTAKGQNWMAPPGFAAPENNGAWKENKKMFGGTPDKDVLVMPKKAGEKIDGVGDDVWLNLGGDTYLPFPLVTYKQSEVRGGNPFLQRLWCAHGDTPKGQALRAAPGFTASELTPAAEKNYFDCILESKEAQTADASNKLALAKDPGYAPPHGNNCDPKTVKRVLVKKGMNPVYESFSAFYSDPNNPDDFWGANPAAPAIKNDAERKAYTDDKNNHRVDLTGIVPFLNTLKTDRNIKKVYVVGLVRNICVKRTALDAAMLGFETKVILDLTRPINAPGQPDTECKKYGEEVLEKSSTNLEAVYFTADAAKSANKISLSDAHFSFPNGGAKICSDMPATTIPSPSPSPTDATPTIDTSPAAPTGETGSKCSCSVVVAIAASIFVVLVVVFAAILLFCRRRSSEGEDEETSSSSITR